MCLRRRSRHAPLKKGWQVNSSTGSDMTHEAQRRASTQIAEYVEAGLEGVAGSTFGAGASHNIVTASVQAMVSVANRLAQRGQAVAKAAVTVAA